MPTPDRPDSAHDETSDDARDPKQSDESPTDADAERHDAQPPDRRRDDEDDKGDKRDDHDNELSPFLQNLCRVINYRRDGTLRPQFPFTDLPLWLGIVAVFAGWNMMSAAEYYGVNNQLMILFAVLLVWILSGKKR